MSGHSNSQKNKCLIIAAGGTGGHIFPGIVIANYLQAKGWEVRWLGTADHMESHLVPKHGINIDCIKISGLRSKGLKAQFIASIKILRAVIQAKYFIKKYQPNIVLGMGGYVSGPSVLAAWLCKIPVILHEQNSVIGLTNSYLAIIAKRLLQAFPRCTVK